MKASIINIGDELLIGQVVNTNASWIADELNRINVRVVNMIVTSDSKEDIVGKLTAGMEQSDVVIVTGGLGPTKDDITKSTLCEMFNDSLIDHEPTRVHVEEYFRIRNLPMLEVNKWQSMVPSKCEVLMNKVGSAPGMWFNEKGKIVVSLPGVPYEMKYIMSHHVLPRLVKLGSDEAVIHKTILTCGIGESYLAEKIKDWEDALPSHIKLAYLPNRGMVRLRLSAYGKDHAQLQTEVDAQLKQLEALAHEHIFGYDDDTMVSVIGRMLKEKGCSISTAESCTGGNISAMITSVSGASEYYAGSIVSYDNNIKIRALNVPPAMIEQYGAVSEQVAVAMARGCLSVMRTDYAIATTGISGPRGETEGKPVGTVFIAIASKQEVHCTKYCFKSTRVEHQMRTANQAIFDLWHLMKNE